MKAPVVTRLVTRGAKQLAVEGMDIVRQMKEAVPATETTTSSSAEGRTGAGLHVHTAPSRSPMLFCLLLRVILILCISCLLVQADISHLTDADIVRDLMNKDEAVLALCGEHPLQAILDRVEGKLEHDTVVHLLATIRMRAARLWKAYEHALSKYMACKLMAGAGTLG